MRSKSMSFGGTLDRERAWRRRREDALEALRDSGRRKARQHASRSWRAAACRRSAGCEPSPPSIISTIANTAPRSALTQQPRIPPAALSTPVDAGRRRARRQTSPAVPASMPCDRQLRGLLANARISSRRPRPPARTPARSIGRRSTLRAPKSPQARRVRTAILGWPRHPVTPPPCVTASGRAAAGCQRLLLDLVDGRALVGGDGLASVLQRHLRHGPVHERRAASA